MRKRKKIMSNKVVTRLKTETGFKITKLQYITFIKLIKRRLDRYIILLILLLLSISIKFTTKKTKKLINDRNSI